MAIPETILALILLVFVMLAVISYGPHLFDLIKISIGLGKSDENNLNVEQTKTSQVSGDIKGKIGAPFIVKTEDQFNPKPTSSDYCLVTTTVTNTGDKPWTESNRIKVTLFCDYNKNQNKNLVQNYPTEGYLKNLEPQKDLAVTFDQFPNNCLKSLKEYQIILYSNCDGIGSSETPCNNFGQENGPKILDMVKFYCKQ